MKLASGSSVTDHDRRKESGTEIFVSAGTLQKLQTPWVEVPVKMLD